MPPIAKPKENRITKLAKAVKARSPLPSFVNDAILPTDVPTDVAGLLPMGTEIQAGASMLSPLISVYKDKAARDAGLKEFIDSVHAFAKNHMWRSTAGTNAWTDAAELFGGQYPRIAAHMRHADVPMDNPNAIAAMDWNQMAWRSPGILKAGKDHLGDLAQNDKLATGTMFHEGTHAAQALGNIDTPVLYHTAAQLLPYRDIPHEASAWMRTDLTEAGILRATQDPRHAANFDRLAARLKGHGISLDQSGDSIRLRKWGMPSGAPENYIPLDADHLPYGLRNNLATYQGELKRRGGWGSYPSYSTQTPRQPGNATRRVTQTLKYDPQKTRDTAAQYPDWAKNIIEHYLKR